jgi:hypothetical protein
MRQPGALKRRVRELEVVGGGSVAHLLAEMRAEVVQPDMQPIVGVQRSEVAAEREELDARLALLDCPLERSLAT